jgi:4'-phosphopantetheinyl transferase
MAKGPSTGHTDSRRSGWPRLALWWAPLDPPADQVDRLASALSERERQRADRYRRPADAEHYRTGRGWLRELLASELRCRPAEVEIVQSDQGKPTVPDSDLHFNTSHSGGLLVVATSRMMEVGVDVEAIRTDAEVDRIAARFFSPKERRALAALADGPRLIGSFECWTRKEALLKGVGVGLRVPLDEVEVWDGLSTTTVLDGWRVHSFHLDDRYAAAVAGRDVGEWSPPPPRRIGSPEAEGSADSIGPRGPLGDGRVPSRENASR